MGQTVLRCTKQYCFHFGILLMNVCFLALSGQALLALLVQLLYPMDEIDKWMDRQGTRRSSTQEKRSKLFFFFKQKTQSLLVNVFSNFDQLISSSRLTSSQGPNSHPHKCSNAFPLSLTLAALNALSLCNSHMLCTLGNTVRTIYHRKSSSKTNRITIKKASTVK